MYKFYFILFMLSMNFNYAQFNNIEIHYKVKILKNLDSKKSKSLTYEAVFNEIENIEMILSVNKSLSSFKEVKALNIDTKTKHFRKMAKLIADLNGEYFCDLENKAMIISTEFDGINYNIETHYNFFKWKLSNDTKIINGYKCQKATTVKTYMDRKGNIVDLKVTAWYSPEFSIPLGPKNYIGLPGLILELHEGNELAKGITYFVSKINLKPKQVVINIPEKETLITEEKFSNITKKAYKNLLDYKKIKKSND